MFCDAFFYDLVRLKEIGFIVKTFPLVNIQYKPYWWLIYNILAFQKYLRLFRMAEAEGWCAWYNPP